MRGLAEDLTSCAVVGLLLPLGLGGQHRGELQMPEGELDLRLHRLLFFSDGVYAIAVTLLAVELVLPETAAELHGRELLRSLLESWPRVLAFLTSFLFIANFWAGHNILFHHVRRFDGGLMWLALFQLLCVAFLPFPTSVVGEHVSDPVAQQFYFGSLLVTGLVMWALWWVHELGTPLCRSGSQRASHQATPPHLFWGTGVHTLVDGPGGPRGGALCQRAASVPGGLRLRGAGGIRAPGVAAGRG